MGYVCVVGNCICCGQTFSFNPHRVPSTSVITGTHEPVCRECMTEINKKRKEMGLEPRPIHDDAYDAIDENEL